MHNEILFATGNAHKCEEVRQIFNLHNSKYSINSLKDFKFTAEIPEDYKTFENNARQKAAFVYDRLKVPCFAEDTGLEIKTLNMEPGYRTARYAGPQKNARHNIRKVLRKLSMHIDRSARFRTVIAFTPDGKTFFYFEGICDGRIALETMGENGFGYDPIFIPNGYEQTFAQLNPALKNRISHRYKATVAFATYIERRRF